MKVCSTCEKEYKPSSGHKNCLMWAQEVLELYAPELLNGCISEAFEAEQDAGSIPAVSSKWSN